MQHYVYFAFMRNSIFDTLPAQNTTLIYNFIKYNLSVILIQTIDIPEIVIFHKVLSAYRVQQGRSGSYNQENLRWCLSER